MSWLSSLFFAGLMVAQSNFGVANVEQIPVINENSGVTSYDVKRDENFDKTYPLNATGKVSVSNINGSVKIEAWDKNEAKVEAIKHIDCEKEPEMEIVVNASPNSLEIKTEYGKNGNSWNWNSNRCRDLSVDYKIFVPATAILNEIETVNGAIEILNMTNRVVASTVNGKLHASGLSGTVNLSAVNGTMTVDFANIERVESIKMETVNGTMKLNLPSDADATVRVETVNGSLDNDFGMFVKKGKYVGRSINAKLGSGKVRINLSDVNGTIEIKRNNDGKQTKTVNLIGPKSDGDSDDDTVVIRGDNVNIRGNENKSISRADAESPADFVSAEDLASLDDVRESLGEAVKGLEIARKTLAETLKNGSAEERQEAKEAFAEANRELAEAQREMAEANRESAANQKEIAKAQTEASRDAQREIARISRIYPNVAIAGTPRTPKLPQLPRTPQLPSLPELPAFGWNRDLNEFPEGSTYFNREMNSFQVSGKPNIKIEAKQVSVRVRGWDKDEVAYSIVKRGNNAENTKLEVNRDGKQISIKAWSTVPTQLDVYVPRKTNLKIDSDLEIRLEGVSGELNLKGESGAIDVRDGGGNLNAEANDGRIRVVGFEGEAVAKTIEGNINLEGDFSKLSTKTASGLTVLTLKETASATIETSAEDIQNEGLSLTKSTNGTWKLGKGGEVFKVQTDGRIIVRSATTLKN